MKTKAYLTIASIILVAFAAVFWVQSCRKPVDEITHEYIDYAITNIDYSIDNDSLNEFSKITFVVTLANKGITDSSGIYVYFYLDGVFEGDTFTQPLEQNASTDLAFIWQSKPGVHTFSFKADITPDDKSYLYELNKSNNVKDIIMEIPLVERKVIFSESIVNAEFKSILTTNDSLVNNVISALNQNGYNLEDNGYCFKATYSIENSKCYYSTITKNGEPDSALYLISYQIPSGKSGNVIDDWIIIPVILEIIDESSYKMYDDQNGLLISDYGRVIEQIESPLKRITGSCSESHWMCITGIGLGGIACVAGVIATFVPPFNVAGFIAALAGCGLGIAAAIACKDSFIDNPPEIKLYDIRGSNCEECQGSYKVVFAYDGQGTTVTDDRGIDYVTSPDKIAPGCTEGSVTFSAKDCGNHIKEVLLSRKYRFISKTWDQSCHDQGGGK